MTSSSRRLVLCVTAMVLVWDTVLPLAQSQQAADNGLARLRSRGEKGEAAAQLSLGLMYAKGEGVPKDAAEAVNWYRKAADQGNADGQFGLGWMYAQGEGATSWSER